MTTLFFVNVVAVQLFFRVLLLHRFNVCAMCACLDPDSKRFLSESEKRNDADKINLLLGTHHVDYSRICSRIAVFDSFVRWARFRRVNFDLCEFIKYFHPKAKRELEEKNHVELDGGVVIPNCEPKSAHTHTTPMIALR